MCGDSGSGGGAPGVGAGIKKAQGWGWGSDEGGAPIAVKPPEDASGVPAIVFSLSATITRDRIERVLGEAVSIWEITSKISRLLDGAERASRRRGHALKAGIHSARVYDGHAFRVTLIVKP